MKLLSKLRALGERKMVHIGQDGRMRCRHCTADMTGAFGATSARYTPLRCPACGTENLRPARSIFSP